MGEMSELPQSGRWAGNPGEPSPWKYPAQLRDARPEELPGLRADAEAEVARGNVYRRPFELEPRKRDGWVAFAYSRVKNGRLTKDVLSERDEKDALAVAIGDGEKVIVDLAYYRTAVIRVSPTRTVYGVRLKRHPMIVEDTV